MEVLRKFNEIYIDKDLTKIVKKHYKNCLFFSCTFDDISNIIFEDCVLTRSKFISNDVKKCLNFAVTLKCSSFKDVEISETIMNLILFLLASTKGNDSKRRKIIGIIGKEKVREMSNKLEGIE